tara:strand:- start:2899 stop:3399 length:501 start_codon:yes stop_codon:yes gene_type:complete
MAGYTEVLQTMFAMILVSLLIINSNRAIALNNRAQVDSELEDQIIAIAQDFIDESRSITFDATTAGGNVPVNIPSGFSSIGPGGGENTRAKFNDFDDYDGWTETIVASNDVEYDVSIAVSYYNGTTVTASKTTLKQMTITITSDLLTSYGNNRNYSFNFIRSFYAD